jgi:hypothetical protein
MERVLREVAVTYLRCSVHLTVKLQQIIENLPNYPTRSLKSNIMPDSQPVESDVLSIKSSFKSRMCFVLVSVKRYKEACVTSV